MKFGSQHNWLLLSSYLKESVQRVDSFPEWHITHWIHLHEVTAFVSQTRRRFVEHLEKYNFSEETVILMSHSKEYQTVSDFFDKKKKKTALMSIE